MTASVRLATLAAVVAVVVLIQGSWFPPDPQGPDAASVSSVSAVAGSRDPIPDGRVITANMPDPAILRVGGTYHLYATQGAGHHVQTATSTDLRTWTSGPDALPVLGPWARTGRTWAPEVLSTPAGDVLFYSALDRLSGLQCIGRAVAAGPAGPFVDDSATPLVCQRDRGGSIDPDPVTADGRTTLYWKNDGNCCGLPVQLWGQRLDVDAGRMIGEPVALLSPTAPWQGRLVEAPEMFARAGRFYLFYSANAFDTSRYAEGVAACASALGPCVDGPGPILNSASTAGAVGPGHAFVFDVGDRTVMMFHAWSANQAGRRGAARSVWMEPVSWVDGAPVVGGPSAVSVALTPVARPPRPARSLHSGAAPIADSSSGEAGSPSPASQLPRFCSSLLSSVTSAEMSHTRVSFAVRAAPLAATSCGPVR